MLGHRGQPPQPCTADYRPPPTLLTIHGCSVLPEPVTTVYAATVIAHARLLLALNEQIAAMEEQVKAHFLAHPDAEIHLSMPGGVGQVTGARVLAEFGDDPTRYNSAKARKRAV